MAKILSVGRLADVREVDPGPQRGAGYERVPPAAANVCQRDQILIHVESVVSVTFALVVQDNEKDFGRDTIYGLE